MAVRDHWLFWVLLGLILVIIACADAGVLASRLGPVLRLPGFDKLAHLILYGLLALLALRAWPVHIKVCRWRFYWAPLLVLGFACAEEFSQMFIAARSADIGDVCADILGVAIATKLFIVLRDKVVVGEVAALPSQSK